MTEDYILVVSGASLCCYSNKSIHLFFCILSINFEKNYHDKVCEINEMKYFFLNLVAMWFSVCSLHWFLICYLV